MVLGYLGSILVFALQRDVGTYTCPDCLGALMPNIVRPGFRDGFLVHVVEVCAPLLLFGGGFLIMRRSRWPGTAAAIWLVFVLLLYTQVWAGWVTCDWGSQVPECGPKLVWD